MRHASLVALTTLFTLSLAVPASAQDAPIRTNGSYAREVSLTYTFLRDVGENGAAGFLFDAGKQLTSTVSLVGEFGVTHFSEFEENYIQGAGGIRVGSVTGPRVRPFAQFLVGGQREFGITGLVLQPGIGLSVGLGGVADLKLQTDFPIVRWDGETYKQFRFSAGIGLALGGR